MFGITKDGDEGAAVGSCWGKSPLNKLWWEDSNFRISDCVVVSAARTSEEDGFVQWFACRDSGVIVRLAFDWIGARYWTWYWIWRRLNSGCVSVGIKQVFRPSKILYTASFARSFNLALLRAMLTNCMATQRKLWTWLERLFRFWTNAYNLRFSIKLQFNASVPHSQHRMLNLSDNNNSKHFFFNWGFFLFFFCRCWPVKGQKTQFFSYMSDPRSCVNLWTVTSQRSQLEGLCVSSVTPITHLWLAGMTGSGAVGINLPNFTWHPPPHTCCSLDGI